MVETLQYGEYISKGRQISARPAHLLVHSRTHIWTDTDTDFNFIRILDRPRILYFCSGNRSTHLLKQKTNRKHKPKANPNSLSLSLSLSLSYSFTITSLFLSQSNPNRTAAVTRFVHLHCLTPLLPTTLLTLTLSISPLSIFTLPELSPSLSPSLSSNL